MAYNVSQASTLATELSKERHIERLLRDLYFDCENYSGTYAHDAYEPNDIYLHVVQLIGDGMAIVFALGYSNKMLNNSIKHYLKERLENDRHPEKGPI